MYGWLAKHELNFWKFLWTRVSQYDHMPFLKPVKKVQNVRSDQHVRTKQSKPAFKSLMQNNGRLLYNERLFGSSLLFQLICRWRACKVEYKIFTSKAFFDWLSEVKLSSIFLMMFLINYLFIAIFVQLFFLLQNFFFI